MTLYYVNRMIPCSLTVGEGAIRGLTCEGLTWTLHVSDPKTMGVSQFVLTRSLLKEVKDAEINIGDPVVGTALLKWLLRREVVECEKLDSEGRPISRLKGQPGPRPSMDLKRTAQTPAPPKPPPAPVDQNPADKPHLLNHPADRPADLSM